MDKIKTKKIEFERKVYTDKIVFLDKKTKKIFKEKPIKSNVQKFKKFMKDKNELGV